MQGNATYCISSRLPPFICLLLHLQNPLVTLASALNLCFFACGFHCLPSMRMCCIFSLRLLKNCWLCMQHRIENMSELVPLLCICQLYTYKIAVAQSFVSVAEADTRRYRPWHCQLEAPPLLPPQKLWLLKGTIHHWTSVLWFDTIVQILPFCPLSPHFLASDVFASLSGFFLWLSDGWINLKITQKCESYNTYCMQMC